MDLWKDIFALAMGSRSLMMTDVEMPKVTKVLDCISVESDGG